MMDLARALIATSLAALAASCYQPRAGDCQLACAEGTQCPSGLTCMGDGFCHAPGATPSCGSIDADRDTGAPIDASDASLPPDASVPLDAISAGNRHACAIVGGALYCWGDNRFDQVGELVGAATNRRFATPHRVGTDTDWTAVAAGLWHTCGIRAGGAVYCWGAGEARQNGTTVTTSAQTPVRGPGGAALTGASAICAGGAHSCAIVGGGSDVVCWGNDTAGQLGDGAASGTVTAQAVAVVQPTPSVQWTAVACGAIHTCAVGDGKVYCWGDPDSNQLGHSGPNTSAPSQAAIASGAVAVTAGSRFSCARMNDNTARCWGSYGNVSGGAPTDMGMTGVNAVSAGYFGLCVSTGAVTRCLGYGGRGDLGNGTFDFANTLASPVTGLTGVTALTSGTDFHCALTAAGARCWGKNSDGQLGQGGFATQFGPRQVPGAWRAVATGAQATCAIAEGTGLVSCWGQNFGGWSFPGNPALIVDTPTAVAGVGAATAIAVGASHACAIEVGGVVRCWGDTTNGRVGDGATGAGVVGAVAPQVSGIDLQARAIAAADHGTAAIGTTAAGLLAWGENVGNRLGLAMVRDYGAPASVDAATTWETIGLGADFGCGLRNGQVYCWGDHAQGQLGTGATMPQPAPVVIPTISFAAVAPAAFGRHVCAIGAAADAGKMFCWGDNSHHQGSSLDPDSGVPRPQGAFTDWTRVAAGGATSCGIRAGTLQCWGANDEDAYAAGVDRAFGDLAMPATIGTDFAEVALGASHGCALTIAGHELWCWGDSRYGATGVAGNRDYATPQPLNLP